MSTTLARSDFKSHRLWFKNVVCENVILRNTSALEFLELFTGFVDEKIIEVYSLENGVYSNINYKIVDSFDNISFIEIEKIKCASFEQVVNDMLSNESDDWALTEALANYYERNHSFDEIKILPENIERFKLISNEAMNYYCEG